MEYKSYNPSLWKRFKFFSDVKGHYADLSHVIDVQSPEIRYLYNMVSTVYDVVSGSG